MTCDARLALPCYAMMARSLFGTHVSKSIIFTIENLILYSPVFKSRQIDRNLFLTFTILLWPPLTSVYRLFMKHITAIMLYFGYCLSQGMCVGWFADRWNAWGRHTFNAAGALCNPIKIQNNSQIKLGLLRICWPM